MRQIDPQQLQDITDALQKTEAKIAGFATDHPGIDIPALNEIRYAFQHFLRALNGKGDENFANSLKHLKRAQYDCYQAEALFLGKQRVDFEQQYDSINLLDHIPDYLNWAAEYQTLREAAEHISDDREKYCDGLEQQLVVVRPIHKKLLVARQELRKVVNAHQLELAEAQAQIEKRDRELKTQEENLRVAQRALDASQQTAKATKIATRAAVLAAAAACATFLYPIFGPGSPTNTQAIPSALDQGNSGSLTSPKKSTQEAVNDSAVTNSKK
ncbi:MAG: hypothetical protein JNL19_12435 [Burkholderiales bacterium]|nr:hypothetical protein [Burkholderiales bacterium]